MPGPMKTGLPPDLVIKGGFQVSLTALDPTTGAVISGVTISQATLYAAVLAGSLDNLAPLPKLVPTDQTV